MLLIKNRVYQALLLAKERFLDGVYSDRDQLDDDKFDKALDDIDKLSEKYLWLRELGKEYMNEKENNPGNGRRDMHFMSGQHFLTKKT